MKVREEGEEREKSGKGYNIGNPIYLIVGFQKIEFKNVAE